MSKFLSKLKIGFVLTACLAYINGQAQFEIGGQLVQRAEYKHGFGKTIEDTLESARSINQRLRLQMLYKSKKLQFFGSIQDVRLWGNTSQIKLSDGLLSLHEGWVSVVLDSAWSIKIGRQELNYDNVRFLGNLDWAMQARAHDFALIKYEKQHHKLHIGLGYNQSSDLLSGNAFITPNQYKAAQMLWYNIKKSTFELSFLIWNNGKESLQYNSTGNIIKHQIKYAHTLGIPVVKQSFWNNNVISGFAYYQFGKDVTNKDLNAYDISLQSSQTVVLNSAKNNTLKITFGIESLSGTPTNNTKNENKSFSPMYGTNHVHNGYMDYFYVGGRFENSVGLNDLYLRLRQDAEKKWFVSCDLHHFSANANVYTASTRLKKQLGTEIDLTGGVIVSEDLSLQAGYSQLFSTSTMDQLLGIKNKSNNQNWAYLMLIVRPKNDKKFIGILN
jgi:hypothetical protein